MLNKIHHQCFQEATCDNILPVNHIEEGNNSQPMFINV